MKLIFAQGNPGKEYEKTRHNVGLFVLERLQDELHGTAWKKHAKALAEVSEATRNGEKVLLVKPLSYYNETGLVARALVDFYKLNPATDVLVLHDDLALPFGTIRTREKGSDAGNNGIKSLNQHLGDTYARVRIGIWNDLRDHIDDADFVLSRFTSDEQKALKDTVISAAVAMTESFLDGTRADHSVKLPR